MRGLLGYTIVGVLLVSATLFFKHAYERSIRLNLGADNTIIRLHLEDGRFFCSGTVITPNAIATAAHCVSTSIPGFGTFIDSDMKIEVRGQDGHPTNVWAHVGGVNGRQDTAMLLGNFTQFDTREIVTDPNQIDKIMMNSSHLVTCGYPLGGKLACSPITKVRHGFYAMYYGQGWMYPGMSGGPIIDLTTGKVLAVNMGIFESGELIFNSLAEFFTDMLRRG